MERVIRFFKGKHLDAIGIRSFGPVDLHKSSSTYGYITSTPKPHWGQFNFLGEIQKEFSVPIGFDTDVNAAALGEIGEDHNPEVHLIPQVLLHLLHGTPLHVEIGYNTPDGTYIRDYLHVMDTARAHVLTYLHWRACC